MLHEWSLPVFHSVWAEADTLEKLHAILLVSNKETTIEADTQFDPFSLDKEAGYLA